MWHLIFRQTHGSYKKGDFGNIDQVKLVNCPSNRSSCWGDRGKLWGVDSTINGIYIGLLAEMREEPTLCCRISSCLVLRFKKNSAPRSSIALLECFLSTDGRGVLGTTTCEAFISIRGLFWYILSTFHLQFILSLPISGSFPFLFVIKTCMRLAKHS